MPFKALQAFKKIWDVLKETPTSKKTPSKPAIALMTYCRVKYFEKVLTSIQAQQIEGKSFSDYFDLYVFQDGLPVNESAANISGHKFITEICKSHLPPDRFFLQNQNLGVALHFDYIERLLFQIQDKPWVAFFEDDLILSQGYLETLHCMAAQFKNDPRVAIFSCFSKTSQQTLQEQEADKTSLISMEHHWGFGMHKSVWLKRQPLVDEYLKLVRHTPYRERENARIQNWHTFCGFKAGPTSQDYAKACAMAGLNMVKVSSFANFGTYIGEYGLHFTPEIFASEGYAKSVLYPRAITTPLQLDEATYLQLLQQQKAFVMPVPERFDQTTFLRRLQTGQLSPMLSDQWKKNLSSEADVVAAYKIFLGRLPESRQVIESRIGVDPEKILASFITSEEFRARKQFHPIILALAEQIVDENKKTKN
jgi:hypothetical protein